MHRTSDPYRKFTDQVKNHPDLYPDWMIETFEARLEAVKAGYPEESRRLLADSTPEGRGEDDHENGCGQASAPELPQP